MPEGWKTYDQEVKSTLLQEDAAAAVRESREKLARARQDFEDELDTMRQDLWAVKEAAEKAQPAPRSRHEFAMLVICALMSAVMGFVLGLHVAQWLHR